MLILDGHYSSIRINEKEDHVDLKFCLNDDLYAIIQTKYLDEIGDFEMFLHVGNSFERNVEEEKSFVVEILDNHD